MGESETRQVVVVGAGPYGLAVAAHLRHAGVDTHVLGEPMRFWRNNMPQGMLLRSAWEASHISDPRRELTLDRYEEERGEPIASPIPLPDFIEYGEWFQRRVVSDVDTRTVREIEASDGRFHLDLEDGESLTAEHVVIATGLARFQRRPRAFTGLSESLVSHSSSHAQLSGFSGRRVLVIGGGQSALESAALLREVGATVEVVIRADRIHWLAQGRLAPRLGPARRILYPPTDVGPPLLNWIVALPDVFRTLPQPLQLRTARRVIRPAGSAWLRSRLGGVPLTVARAITSAEPVGEEVVVRLDDATERRVDHVLLATGYRVDVTRYSLLAPALLRTVRTLRGSPALVSGFESSVPGLHFVGAAAAESFGPLMKFVAGTGYTARELTSKVVGTRRRRRPARGGRALEPPLGASRT